MLLHNLICWRAVHPLGGKKLKVSEKPAHLSISFFFLPLSVSFSLTLFTHDLPSLMSACCTQGPCASVQFLFWHPFLITHVNDWSPGLGRGSRDGSPCYMMALRLCPSSGQFLLPGTVETDTCNGPRAGRLSSEHPLFGPKTLPISGPWRASCTGAARYLLLFVWSNPTQLKPRLSARTFKPTLWHLRGLATESRTQLLLWNVIWLIDFGVASLEMPWGGESTGIDCDGSRGCFLSCIAIQAVKWTCCC